MNNLNSTRRMAAGNLSVPGCWGYPDMMEVGVTAMAGMHDCGVGGNETCLPLTVEEARTHFNAWAIVSSPLVLGFDLRNSTMLNLHWPTISNVDAIEVNQDYAGFSGTRFAVRCALSGQIFTFEGCH
jgi:alpha-galactosidase